jgi:hypothetical protein
MTTASKTVAEQVTDSITQITTNTLGIAPAHAMATLYQTSAASAGLAIQNAVHAQNNQNMVSRAVTTQAVHLLLSSAQSAQAQAFASMDQTISAFSQRLSQLVAAMAALDDKPKK